MWQAELLGPEVMHIPQIYMWHDVSLVWLDNMVTVLLQGMHQLGLVSLHRDAINCGQ